MSGPRGWMIVWCRRCSISPIVTSTGWDLFCHASSLSVLCIRGRLSPLHEASRRSGMLWSSLITWVHSHYCTIIPYYSSFWGMSTNHCVTPVYHKFPLSLYHCSSLSLCRSQAEKNKRESLRERERERNHCSAANQIIKFKENQVNVITEPSRLAIIISTNEYSLIDKILL